MNKEIINLDSKAIIDKNIIEFYDSLFIQGEIKNIFKEKPLSIISIYLKHNFKNLNVFMIEGYFWKNALKNVRGGFRMNFSSGENKN